MSSKSLKNIISKILIILTLSVSAAQSNEFKIIRDAEIEAIISEVARPILEAANFKDEIRFYLFADDEINAFTPGQNMIFLSSGLLRTFPEVEVIRGVIAHELGHIMGHHIMRSMQFNDQLSSITQLVSGAIIAGMLATKEQINTELLAPVAALSSHYLRRSILKYSRDSEVEADQRAIKLLLATKTSCKGLIKFHNHLINQHHNLYANQYRYDATHPLSQERISVLRNYEHIDGNVDTSLAKKLKTASVKLNAFTLEPKAVISQAQQLSASDRGYTLAIAYFRLGDMHLANQYIDALRRQFPSNPYYLELKGQILFMDADTDSISFYRQAANMLPHNSLIRLSKGIVGISFNDDPKILYEFFTDILFATKTEPNNALALKYLAIYYGKTNQPAKAALTMAQLFSKLGQKYRALQMAKQARQLSAENSPTRRQAIDIIYLWQNQQSK